MVTSGMPTKRVAIVDDDPMIRMLIEEYLKAFGFEVISFAEPAVAVPSIAANPVDLLLVDLQMPGMNGAAVISALRNDSRTTQIPIVLLSANASDLEVTSEIDADRFLEKPFQMNDLIDAVVSTCRHK